MKYRDNDAHVKSPYVDDSSFKREYTVSGGTCRLTGVSITGGQDPSGRNYVGQQKSIAAGGRLRFSVGRKGSTAVASWWKQRLPANQCTFNDTPDKLNFAFKVDLVVHLTGGNLGSRVARIRLDDIYIGQGKAGASNNWWFGGRHCTHIGGGKVRIEGLDLETKLKVHLDVRRGGSNPVNQFEFSNYRVASTHSWMKGIASTTPLNRIVMPGSHDAGMGQTRNCAPPVFAAPISKTQRHSMRGQLDHGARYFDLRVDYDKRRLVTYHRTKQWGCSGEYVDSILAAVDGFLAANPSETVILKFSHTRTDNGDPDTTKRLLDRQIGSFARRYRDESVTNLATLPLSAVRGKAIMVFDYPEHYDKGEGRYRYNDGTSGKELAVYDEYSKTTNLDTMRSDQLRKWRDNAGLGKDYLFLLSWTLTPRALTSPSALQLADLANAPLPGELDRYSKEYGTKPNIVLIDGVDRSVTSSIVALNFT